MEISVAALILLCLKYKEEGGICFFVRKCKFQNSVENCSGYIEDWQYLGFISVLRDPSLYFNLI